MQTYHRKSPAVVRANTSEEPLLEGGTFGSTLQCEKFEVALQSLYC